MAGQFIDGGGGLFERFERPSTFFLANLAWLVLAIPLVTIPLGTVGLFQVMSLWVRGKQPEFFTDFFSAIRRLWWKASLVGLIDLAVAALVYANMLILNQMELLNPLALLSRSVTLFVALLLLLVNLYVWSLLVISELSLRRIIELSFKLAFAHPLRSIGILIGALLPPVFALALPVFVWLLGLISLSVLIVNWGTWQVIRRYIPEAELAEYESQGQ